MNEINKAFAISDAKISFVSLVDKAANQKEFLITKSEEGTANFQTFGRILKSDDESHYVTGIVYEPMVEDSHGNYMTEEEITKAAHWFMKHDGDVDIQHCFEKANNVEVVESYVVKADCEIAGELIKKGTWVMTMEVSDSKVWESIEKGELTGFSMGGVGCYSDEDVDLESVEKAEEKETLFQKFAKSLGYECVKKGAVKDYYNDRVKNSNFWEAFYAMENVLECYHQEDDGTWTYGFSTDESEIREALRDFCDIAESLLINESSIVKSLETNRPIEKAGKCISSKNLETLKGIASSLSSFCDSFSLDDSNAGESEDEDETKGEDKNNDKEDTEVTKAEIENLVTEVVSKSLEPITKQLEEITKADAAPAVEPAPVEKEAPAETELNAETVSGIVAKAVEAAMAPITEQLAVIKQSRALPSNLNDAPEAKVEKAEEHYLHGIL